MQQPGKNLDLVTFFLFYYLSWLEHGVNNTKVAV